MFTTDITKYPTNAGIYLFKDKKDTIIYIGKAKNIQKRLGQYFTANSLRKQEMLQNAVKVDFLTTKNESEALYLEDNLIKQHQPFYNNLLKADNSYTYIKITKEKFPQIFLTKRRIKDGSIYIGPKKDSIQLKKFLQYLRQILKFRGCKTTQFNQEKLCSDYYFGLCRGRCKLAKTKSLPSLLNKGGRPRSDGGLEGNEGGFDGDYKDIIHTITSFFKGNTKPIEREIHEQIEIAIIHENFERAAQLRDIYASLQGFVEKQDVVLSDKKDGYLALTKSIGNQRIYTVLIFVQGKLMDVITSKESQDDIDEDSLYLAIQRTFGVGEIKKQKNETYITSQPKKLRASLIKEVSADADGGFEWKPKQLKPLLQLAENFLESYIITQSLQEESTMINDMFTTLQNRYHLKHIPYRIECIDISHLSGGRTSGGLSCLMAGLPYKKGYRRYKIKAKKSDDYEALQELLERRFSSLKSSSLKSKVEENDLTDVGLYGLSTDFPNLLIIDGGKGQLNVVKKLCKDPKRKEIANQIDIISLGKGEARTKSNIGKLTKGPLDKGGKQKGGFVEDKKISETIYTLDQNLKIHQTPMAYDQADKIFLKARDEAHRFANNYRKKQMSKEFNGQK